MAKSESKRQKRLAKQKAKRSQKKHEITRIKSMGLAERLGKFESAPVLACFITKTMEEQGIANLFISRRAASGDVALAVFLIDRYCLGVKDCLGKLPAPGEYGDIVEHYRGQGIRPIDPASAKRLIEDAVAYASSFGFSPHADFRRAFPIFNGIDSTHARENFEMGKDGKPFFMAGPYDSVEKSQAIIARLHALLGTDGYHYMMPVSESEALRLGSFDGDDEGSDYEDDEYENEEFHDGFDEDDGEPRHEGLRQGS